MSTHAFRELTEYERAIIERLLTLPLGDRSEMLERLSTTRARVIDTHRDNYGSIEFDVPQALIGQARPIAEGEAFDHDGVPIDVILFAARGTLVELEILKLDGSPIVRRPEASDFEVWISGDTSTAIPPERNADSEDPAQRLH